MAFLPLNYKETQMNILSLIMLAFAVLGALDRIIGNKFGLGAEFERGFMLLGNMALTMIGVIVLAPTIALYTAPAFDAVYNAIGIDPSIFAASILANDSGGTPLAFEIMKDISLGGFNALVVSSMMGCTISYTIPYALGVVEKERYNDMFLGMLCGIVTIPIGCFISGIVLGIPMLPLLWNLAPLIFLSAVVALGLALAQRITIKIFYVVGILMKIIITVGLVASMIEALTGWETIPGLAPISEGGMVCINAAVVLSGAFPLMFVVSKILKKPLALLGKKLKVNNQSTLGLITTIVSSTPTFEMVNKMDRRGIILNSAFAISAAFTFGGHLAFTMAYSDISSAYVAPMIIAKLVSGACAFALALPIAARTVKKSDAAEHLNCNEE